MASLVWLVTLAVSLVVARLRGPPLDTLWPYALAASLPALTGIALSPVIRRKWAQVLVIFAWIALATAACFVIGFVPMVLLFLCAPAATALFERENVMEVMVLGTLFAGLVFYLGQSGSAPDAIADTGPSGWSAKTGIMATMTFMAGAMFLSTSKKDSREYGRAGADIMDVYPGAMLQFSSDGRLLASSREANKIFGLDRHTAGKARIDTLLMDDGGGESLEMAFKRAGAGQAFPTDTGKYTLKFVTAGDGSVFTFINFRNDGGEKIPEPEQALSERKPNENNMMLLAEISHELRTPLNAIIGFSDMMRSRLFGPFPEKYAEYAEMIHDSGQHMLDVIGDILDISKIRAGKYELHYSDFDVVDVIRSSVRMIRPSADLAGVSLNTDIPANTDLIIEADCRAVRQILLNLLGNSVKFTPEGGRISLAAKIVNNALNLCVEDTGLGMSAAELADIGKPFNQSSSARRVKERGSGLGLSLVKHLVEMHDGRFAISSHPGCGTTVNVYLPSRCGASIGCSDPVSVC